MADFPTQLGSTHNAAAWKKLKFSKDFNLGKGLETLGPAMADFSKKQKAKESLDAPYTKLSTLLRNTIKAADMVSKLPKLPDAVADFCEKVTLALKLNLKHATSLYAEKEASDTGANKRVTAYIKEVEAHIATLSSVAAQFAGAVKTMEDDLKHALKTIELMKTASTEQQLKNLVDVFRHDDIDPIENTYAKCKTVYEKIAPVQAAYRNNPMAKLAGLDRVYLDNATTLLSAQFSKSDVLWRDAEKNYKSIKSCHASSKAARQAADSVVASRYGQYQKQQEGLAAFVEKITKTIWKSCKTITALMITKGAYERDYKKETETTLKSFKKDAERISDYISKNLRNYENVILSSEKTINALLEEIRKRAAECIKMLPAKGTPAYPVQAMKDFEEAMGRANDLVAYAGKNIPAGKKSIKEAIALAQKALAKNK